MPIAALLVSVGIGALGAIGGPAPAPPVLIEGTVVDADRRPAEAVGIYFSDFRGRTGRGEVVGRTETDAQGRFRLEVPGAAGGGPEPGVLWAYRPGSLVASYGVGRETLPPDWPVSMVIDVPARAEFLIRGPDGRPVAGARVRPAALHGLPYVVPEGLAEQIADRAITDARGRAVLTAFFPEEIATVSVSAPGLGRQYFGFESYPGSRKPRTIELGPVGRVEGRIVADDPEIARNRRLLAVISDERRGAPALGLEYLMTDPQGRFVIPQALAGGLSVYGNPHAGSPWFLSSVNGPKVEAGLTIRVEVKAFKGVRLNGTVCERGTKAPIAGVGVSLYRTDRDDERTVRTDDEGRFVLYAQEGGRPNIMVAPPEGFAPPMFGTNMPRILRGVAEFDLPPIELSRAGTVTGVVVDERGEPAPGAAVLASYPVDEGPQIKGRQERRAIAGPRGEFRIPGVVAGVPVVLSGVAPDGRRTLRSVESKAGADPSRLVLAPSGAVSLAGRVIDTSGRRVAGARVHIRVQDYYPGGRQIKGDPPVEIRGAYTIKTREDGWFRTPTILDPDRLYSALVEADGYNLARTIWTEGKARRFPDLVLYPRAEPGLIAVEGSVADRAGRSVPDAAVWIATDAGTSIRATSDVLGRFRLEGVPPRRSFLFAEAQGFRFFGRLIDPAPGSVSIELTRPDERPTDPMRTLPPPRPRAAERALSRRLILPFVERLLKDGGPAMGWQARALDALAYADPARVLAIIDRGVPVTPHRRLICARAMWEDGRAAALAVIEALPDGEWRIRGHLDACRAIPTAERQARIDQVDQALEQARAIADGDSRVRWLGQIAGRYLDLGEVERGTKLLRETLPAARALPKERAGGFARGSFAEVLARVAPAAALELIEGITDRPAVGEHRIDVIKRIVAIDPARAEALLATIEDPNAIADNLPSLCYAMARKDPARARRLVDRKPGDRPVGRLWAFYRPYAIGMIALALADTDRARSARFLDEAFAALTALAAEGHRGFAEIQDAATIAAALVPVAERIDPALVPEFFWRAASFRVPSRSRPDDAATRDATLALLLARYDRDAAMVLLTPLLDRGPFPDHHDPSILPRALAAVAPERAVALVESMSDDPGVEPRGRGALSIKDHARIELDDFLGRPPAERWDRTIFELLNLWVVGGEDAF